MIESKAPLTERVKTALQKKVDDHNEKFGDDNFISINKEGYFL